MELMTIGRNIFIPTCDWSDHWNDYKIFEFLSFENDQMCTRMSVLISWQNKDQWGTIDSKV